MPRLSLSCVLPAVSLIALSGCGGSKTNFSVKPVSYSVSTASPAAATGVALAGVSRDGRLVGTYLNAGKVTVFGWSADGPTTDLILPTECKTVDGIDELGTVACSDRTVTPNKMFFWHGGQASPVTLPTAPVLGVIGGMSFEAGIAANIQSNGALNQGFRLLAETSPVALTAAGGGVNGVSLNGNVAGFEVQGALTHAIAWIKNNKLNLGLYQGSSTTGMSVNDAGIVVGVILGNGGPDGAFKWAAGKYTKLALPAGATAARALDVTDDGIISGEATVAGKTEACIWFPETGPVLVKSLATVPTGAHLDRAVLTTPLGIVVCVGTITTGANVDAAVFGLFPNFP